LASELQARPVHELATQLAEEKTAAARRRLAKLSPEARRQQLADDWARLLGRVEPIKEYQVREHKPGKLGGTLVERISLELEDNIVIPLILLLPETRPGAERPLVVAFAQEGKQEFFRHRAEILAELLQAGIAVCLADFRGTGETRPAGESRGRSSAATSLSSTELMLGQTLLGARLRDLRSVLAFLRTRPDMQKTRVALWGDSFAPPNPRDRGVAVPLDAEKLPALAEPLGGILAILAALYEDQVHVVYAQGGLLGFASLLESPFCWVPHDVIVPGALMAGDLGDVVATLAPRPLRLVGLIDGRNRLVERAAVADAFDTARAAYRQAKAEQRLEIEEQREENVATARWLVRQLQAD
jgi:hypothetical protein